MNLLSTTHYLYAAPFTTHHTPHTTTPTVHQPLQDVEKNWSPYLDGDGVLHVVRSLDPLQVLRCDDETGDCEYVHNGAAEGEVPEIGALRGGTSFVHYRYVLERNTRSARST